MLQSSAREGLLPAGSDRGHFRNPGAPAATCRCCSLSPAIVARIRFTHRPRARDQARTLRGGSRSHGGRRDEEPACGARRGQDQRRGLHGGSRSDPQGRLRFRLRCTWPGGRGAVAQAVNVPARGGSWLGKRRRTFPGCGHCRGAPGHRANGCKSGCPCPDGGRSRAGRAAGSRRFRA